jgi:glucose/arabinose dehydrogenase
MRRLGLVIAGLALAGAANAAPQPYVVRPGQTCDGFPRAQIAMAPGMCAGLVVAPSAGGFARRQLRQPRAVLPLGGADWLVVDLGGWGSKTGAVWRLTAQPGKPAALRRLLSGLALPHGVARGPDGKVYVGEMTRIFRFDPDAAAPAATIEVVAPGLPENRLHDDRHPLSAFVFDGDGALIVNVGAPSDQCAGDAARPAPRRCLESEAGEKAATLRRYAYLGAGRWDQTPSVLASGLRNSVALARHASGAIVQGENSYDFNDPDAPYDEINLIRAGGFYGWPYCYDRDRPAPLWKGAFDCASAGHTGPALLLPPHAAPIGMAYYDGAMFPQLKGRLLMTWRGYRSTGARVVAYRTGPDGAPVPETGARFAVYRPKGGVGSRAFRAGAGPAAGPMVLTTGWNLAAGARPRGAPTGLAVAPDGSIWVTDDKNGAVVRIAADRP